jgi:pilus assembly protein Flp/PilA
LQGVPIYEVENFHQDENGQDLVEYALVTAIVSLGAVTALNVLASGISAAFNNVVNVFGTAIW